MDQTTIMVSGALLAIVTGFIGRAIGSNGRVKENSCGERREACNKLISEKLHTMDEKLDSIVSVLKDKNFLSL